MWWGGRQEPGNSPRADDTLGVPSGLVDATHSAGLKVHAYTFGNENAWRSGAGQPCVGQFWEPHRADALRVPIHDEIVLQVPRGPGRRRLAALESAMTMELLGCQSPLPPSR